MRRPSLLTTVAACVLASLALGEAQAKGKGKFRPAAVPHVVKTNAAAPVAKPPMADKAAAASEKPATAPALTPERLTPALDNFGLSLLESLTTAKGSTPNAMVSPASAAAVLALLDLGAGADMRLAMHKTLGLAADKADATADMEALRGIIAPLMAGAEGSPLKGASAVLFDPASPPFPLAVIGLKAAGAEVTTEKLSDPAILERVNGFISKATEGQIPKILDKVPNGAGLIALNALHFKDKWEQPFDPKLTKDGPFNLAGKKTVTVPMMVSGSEALDFLVDDKFAAVRLPYAHSGYSLVLVTTKSGAAEAREFRPALALLNGEGFKHGPVKLTLPRFSISGGADLLPSLDKLGLRPARLNSKSLAGLSPGPQTIAEVLQKSVIKVDEMGTEAAAATSAQTQRGLPSASPTEITLDRPFVFALQHKDSGVVVMTGYVGDPSKAE